LSDEILQQMRDGIASRQSLMTLHAEEEMSDENLTIYDRTATCRQRSL
jgi:hypothetical protein